MVYRLAELQLIHPDENRNNAILQYTNEVTINAKRGTIYDRTMQKLAVSTTVQTVFISPSDIKDDAQEELIINGLNEILGVDKDYIRERAAKKSSRYQIIKKNVEGEEEEAVRRFIEENEPRDAGLPRGKLQALLSLRHACLAGHRLGRRRQHRPQWHRADL